MQQLLGTIVAAMHALAVPTDFRPNACNPAPVSRSSSNCTHLPACLPACLPTCLQLEVCKEQVEWATSEKRTFLRQRIEVRLAMLQMERRDYPAALALIGGCRVMCVVQGVGYMWWLGGAAGLAFAAP